MALKDQLRDARRKAGLTQEQAAQLIGVSKSTWAGYEIGNSRPDADKIGAILEALQIDANTLFEYKESPAQEDAEDSGRVVTMEMSNRLFDILVEGGLIQDGSSFTEEDSAFLQHIIGLLDVWFRGKCS